ncbi:MAG: homoserine kinase [Rickettsiales bacterium]
MAVYTKLSDDDIAGFLGRYNIGTLASAHGIAEGIENTNYLIATQSSRYILTLFEKRVEAKDIPFFLDFTEWLADRDIACPRPIKGRDGNTCYTLAGKPAAIIQFLEGKGSPNITNYHVEQLGALMARMHLAAKDFPQERENSLSLAGWKEMFASIGKDADKVMDGLADMISAELDYLSASWPKDLPKGVVHADLFPDNVFFQDEQLSGVIDFYFSCTDFWLYDLMITINAWCFNGVHEFNAARAKTMLQSYHAIRPITPEERAAMQVLARGAALRFLLTRTYDWLNRVEGAIVTTKDPMEYVKKLQFHQKNNPLAPI